ncbi:MAG: carbon-monoxide dehydrogenase small subunit [Halioglobus sp.]|jgi:carbon-monoxide dehydrogenase small subunit
MHEAIPKVVVDISVNGADYQREIEPRLLLVEFIREELGLTGTHVGCDTSYCGACTVILDGKIVKSCTLLAVQADGRKVETVEGLETDGVLHPLQSAFSEHHGLQCGYCTPGMLMAAKSLLDSNPKPSEDQIRKSISGNTCRCTGYVNIVKAIDAAAVQMWEG